MIEKMKFEVRQVNECPLCNSTDYNFLYFNNGGGRDDPQGILDFQVEVVKCSHCGLVYSKSVLTEESIVEFFSNYASSVHNQNSLMMDNRKKMYELEHNFVAQFLPSRNSTEEKIKVLDVGCGEGGFLEFFSSDCICEGVEIGEESSEVAARKFKIHRGRLPDISFDKKYDLIIFRGVIQYLDNVRVYFDFLNKILSEGGYIYFTSTPNVDSICHQLYKEKFSLSVNALARNGFSPDIVSKWFKNQYRVVGLGSFYEETPYANPREDIKRVNQVITELEEGKGISDFSPPFWGNMFSLILQKI